MRDQGARSKFDALLHRYGATFDDLKFSHKISPSQINDLEQGDFGRMSIDTLIAIAVLLKCEIVEVLECFKDRPPTPSG